MNFRNTFTALALAAALTATAVPAKRHVLTPVTQPDGTTLQIRTLGDENLHYFTTADGYMLVRDDSGAFTYATLDATGTVVSTGITACDSEQRTPDQMQFLQTIDQSELVGALHRTAQVNRHARSNEKEGEGLFTHSFPTKGSPHTIVILVEYADVSFKIANPAEYFNNILNTRGYKDGYGNNGSVIDYFETNSAGAFTPVFDVYGPVRLPQPRKYYGQNNNFGNDMYPQHMMRDAAQLLDDQVDFSKYDTDGDGFVENVYIFYAGKGEADNSNIADLVWPHNKTINAYYTFDGVKLNRYTCSNEITASNVPVGIGTFTHEFSHVLGLPDEYDTQGTHYATADAWSVLDYGPYLNDGRTPPGYSAFQRNACGWIPDGLHTLTAGTSVTLGNIHDNNVALMAVAPDADNEWFLFEYRKRTGWDSFLPADGMLVWHIRYLPDRWTSNSVNADKNNQLIELVKASNKYPSSANDYINNITKYLQGYCFPGTSNRTCFTYDGVVEGALTEPYFATYRDADFELPITNIRIEGDCVRFDVGGGGQELDLSAVATIAADQQTAISVNGNIVSAPGTITLTDIAGRTVARGNGAVTAPAKGIYIVKAGNSTAKIAVK